MSDRLIFIDKIRYDKLTTHQKIKRASILVKIALSIFNNNLPERNKNIKLTTIRNYMNSNDLLFMNESEKELFRKLEFFNENNEKTTN